MALRSASPLEKILGRLDDLDTTDLTILVQRLARERRLLETVVNTVREGILVINRDGVVEYANDAAGRIIGFKPREIGRVVLWKLVPDLVRTLDFEADGSFSEVSVVSRELQLTYPENLFVRLYLVPIEEVSHTFAADDQHYAVILSDITEEKLSAREMLENEKVSSILMLAAGVAHELGNPLNSLTIHLQLIKRGLDKLSTGDNVSSIASSVGICRGEVDRLDGIVSNFLEAVQPQQPNFRDLDPLSVFEEVLDVLGHELRNRNIVVEIERGNDRPIILADPGQLKQAFFNILKNAYEAMEGGGTIKILARNDDEYVYLQVGDSGHGIERENLSRVFYPYFTTKVDGHGLGMMIVQRIMRDHGGQIGIDSRVGTGTVITFQFPQKHRRVRLLEK